MAADLASVLRAAREGAGLHPEELAVRIFKSRGPNSGWQYGDVFDALVRWLRALECVAPAAHPTPLQYVLPTAVPAGMVALDADGLGEVAAALDLTGTDRDAVFAAAGLTPPELTEALRADPGTWDVVREVLLTRAAKGG